MIKSPFSTGGQVFWWLTFGLVLLNFLQAGFTDLDPDEAYYWVYAQDLAFGYFDHPLAVALLISIGSTLFDNEFGVRFMTVLFQVLTFSGMWVLVGKPSEKKESGLFFLLLAAMPMLQVYGFITTPDVPLLACAVWYLVWFVRFVDNPSWRNTLILAFLMAALLYSKYHGVVWIGLIGLSHFG
ncbi:MAG: glycosyltransferase family 39 protein [Saprospiraceae bacterium]|nr:glycosyltransferase family 39 protein [Saprospiraceae bacterium]